MLSFFVLGLFTSTIGVIIPLIEGYYNLTDIQVSVIFLVPPIGYVLAAQLNGLIHLRFGQRGIAIIGPLFHLVFAGGAAVHPPFLVLLLAVAAGSFGAGLVDASWCAWAAGLENANAISGLLHGSYSVGAAAGPFFAGSFLSAGHRPWYHWYYVLVVASLVELLVLPFAFRWEDAKRYREDKHHAAFEEGFLAHAKDLVNRPVMWACAAYLLTYAGTELAISHWIVVYMIRARHASAYLASVCSSGFWIGMAVGRVGLGYVTDRVGIRPATVIYLLCAMASDLLFGAIDTPAASVVFMALLGFFCGPLYPSCIVRLNLLLPRALHVLAVSFVASVGQVGGALLPFGLGALAQKVGIQVFQTAIFAQLAASLLLWTLFPRPPSTTNDIDSEPTDEEACRDARPSRRGRLHDE
ncbi:MFS general substrate transporter [Pleurostoma richardsiae]|uniref:MFS general substrate transporter n=1 Tax=Pleurostoma richardsiae TaxID=41990 RepID=A0AA38RH76_9PEZI|nr:MFS general substrate transporter [Pleurostoma richardsiae]